MLLFVIFILVNSCCNWFLLLYLHLFDAGLFAGLGCHVGGILNDRNGSLRFCAGLSRFRVAELP